MYCTFPYVVIQISSNITQCQTWAQVLGPSYVAYQTCWLLFTSILFIISLIQVFVLYKFDQMQSSAQTQIQILTDDDKTKYKIAKFISSLNLSMCISLLIQGSDPYSLNDFSGLFTGPGFSAVR